MRLRLSAAEKEAQNEDTSNETEGPSLAMIQNRHRHKHCLDPRLGHRLICLSGTCPVPRPLHQVPSGCLAPHPVGPVGLAPALTDKAAGRFSPLSTPVAFNYGRAQPLAAWRLASAGCRFHSPSMVLLRSTHQPFVPKTQTQTHHDLKSQRLTPKRKLYLASG
jgi:hypothetical protein